MPSIGIFSFEIRDAGSFGLNRPEAFIQIEDSQPPVGEKISVQFFKDGDQGSL